MSVSRPAPIIARISGLPCDAVDAFSSPLNAKLDAITVQEGLLQKLRTELVDVLHRAIHDAPPERRHALLAIKRDCYNGRPLYTHFQNPRWHFAQEAAGTLIQEVSLLESMIEQLKRDFADAYGQERLAQYARIAAMLDDPVLQAGLAISSPLVAQEAVRLRRKTPDQYGRREKRLVATLARYISRAALKLSPFSTFTPIGLCQVEEGNGALELQGAGWQRHSLVRLRRHILDRCISLLLQYGPWRNVLAVKLNDSSIPLQDGRTLHRCPDTFRIDVEKRSLEYHRESLVRFDIKGPVIEFVSSLLAAGTVPYGELVSALAGESNLGLHPEQAGKEIDKLIELGYLHLILPWSDDESHTEKIILKELLAVPATPGLRPFLATLERLVELEEGFLASASPTQDYGEMNKLVDDLLRNAAKVADVPAEIDVTHRASTHDIYQDVLCCPTAQGDAILGVGTASLQEALSSVRPLMRFSQLYEHRLDFLYSLGSLLKGNSPEPIIVPLLLALDSSLGLWRQFVDFEMAGSSSGRSFNPYDKELLHEVARCRDFAKESLPSCFRDELDERRISINALEALTYQFPAEFWSGYTGVCAFVQPASRDGAAWVLNGLVEGTGRMASRYTALLPPGVKLNYVRELSRRSRFEHNGETVELLDVHCVQGDTLNIHAPQTAKVLVLSGTSLNLPAQQQLKLSDLVIHVGADGWPQLRDRKGKRYLPVHLGLAGQSYMPLLVKFLCMFGPRERITICPPALQHKTNGIVRLERITIGNVILQRRRWRIPVETIQSLCNRPAESEAFMALHKFRGENNLPERVFALERIQHPVKGVYFKPQYLDLTSPVFIPILAAVTASARDFVVLTEMLPAAAAFPRDSRGRPWAVELLLDSINLQPAVENIHARSCAEACARVPVEITDTTREYGGTQL
ncbi:MAG: Lantibiotic dehydratase domain protein [Candidatus Angelobacter sp.]|nr:Lantibiotic dehydratase domain protein [Candidatus Angelobacter sp.]